MSKENIIIVGDKSVENRVRMFDVVWVDMSDTEYGKRPAIVIMNDKGNLYGNKTIVIFGTTQIRKLYLPCNFIVKANQYGLTEDTMFMANAIHTIPKKRILKRVGHIDDWKMKKTILDAYMSNVGTVHSTTNVE